MLKYIQEQVVAKGRRKPLRFRSVRTSNGNMKLFHITIFVKWVILRHLKKRFENYKSLRRPYKL